MNYNILHYIKMVSEEKSFTKAAEKLYMSQPSLSQIIKKEEKKLGIALFNRESNPITLTSAGKEYILWANQVLILQEKMKKRLCELREDENILIHIGILPELSTFVLPKALKYFLEKNSKTCVQIHELSSNDLNHKLENHELDFIVGLSHTDIFNYHNEPLYDEKIVLAVAKDSSFLDRNIKKVNLKELWDKPFIIMEEEQFLYKVTYNLCKENGFVPRVAVKCYNLQTALDLVKADIGISIIPDLMIKIIDDVCCYEIEGLTPKSQISIVYSRNKYLSNKARELIEFIKG